MIELLYREKFGLSWWQMQAEPAEAVEWWAAVEAARQKAINDGQKTGASGRPRPRAPLDAEDMN